MLMPQFYLVYFEEMKNYVSTKGFYIWLQIYFLTSEWEFLSKCFVETNQNVGSFSGIFRPVLIRFSQKLLARILPNIFSPESHTDFLKGRNSSLFFSFFHFFLSLCKKSLPAVNYIRKKLDYKCSIMNTPL